MARPVHKAMADKRPEKATVREIWLECIRKFSSLPADKDIPLYFTLCGSEGLDIKYLVDNGIIRTTDTGAIHKDDLERIVAVEFDPMAALNVQRIYPGLTVREIKVENLLHGSAQTAWPTGTQKRDCRARVVNLDLNSTLEVIDDQDQLVFPLIRQISKLAHLHAIKPAIDWTLLLTLHGEIHWDEDALTYVAEFLADNCRQDADFERDLRRLLTPKLVNLLLQTPARLPKNLTKSQQQAILMAFVPKKIVHLIHADGWKITTSANLKYGGANKRAPMVTWAIDFTWDKRATRSPKVVYKECISEVLRNVGRITTKGKISTKF